MLLRLGIQPMEVGLNMTMAYEAGTIYDKSVMAIDEGAYIAELSTAARDSLSVAIEICYLSPETTSLIVGRAYRNAKAVAKAGNVMTADTIAEMLAKGEAEMLSLKSSANISEA